MSVKGNGVCRLEVAAVEWNPVQPWQKTPQVKSTGTAFVIDNERLLTNAHVVRSAIDIRVRPHGFTRRFPAKVVCYAPDVDLAILEILGENERTAFFQSINRASGNRGNNTNDNDNDNAKRQKASKGLTFATELPALQEAVHVVGFPTGGKTICVTEGVVSRIDMQSESLCIQVDSAINPGNSGGPAFNSKGEVTGIAFKKQVSSKAQKVDNIGYLIPSVIVIAFLDRFDAKTKTYKLSGTIPYRFHSLENHSLRLAHNVPDSLHGVLITSVASDTNIESKQLQPGDILTKIDNQEVADDGQMVLRGDELIQHSYLMRIKKKNEPVIFTIYRNGKFMECDPYILNDIQPIIPRWVDVDYMPNYMLLGSLVLLPFSVKLRNCKHCGTRLIADCVDYYRKWPKEWDGKEGLVILTEIFAHELSFSYIRPWRRVVTYNEVKIKSLEHLQDLWNDSCSTVQKSQENGESVNGDKMGMLSFVRLGLENDDDIVFEVESAMKAQTEVMETHSITKAYHFTTK